MSESRPDRRSIVFFMLDQLSARWLEPPTSLAYPTPSIDRLRAEGVCFSNAYTSNPVCCPARATLATGLTTRGHGVLQNGYELDPALPTFMRALQGSGWRTGAFGKLHFHVHFHGVHPDYRPYGYDVVHNTEDPRAGEWLDWVAEEYPEHYDDALATIWPTKIPEIRAYGPGGENLGERVERIRRDYVWDPEGAQGYYALPFPEPMSQTSWITQHALDFIRETAPSAPLHAHISYVQPHSPSCPPAEYLPRVDASLIPPPAPIEWTDDALAPVCFAESEGVRTKIPADWRARRHHYFADVAHLDDQLGKVIDALERAGRWESTYLVLLADHGELLLDHGFTGKGERHYDACIRVPLIISGPGLARGSSCDAIVQLEDICPTVLEMAGLPAFPVRTMGPYLREETGSALPGQSLLSHCRGDAPSEWRDSVYVESYNNIGTCTTRNWARTIRTAEWRYTFYPGGAGEQLFHMSEEPDETINLAGDSGYAPARREMRDRLLESVILQDYPHTERELFAIGVH